MIHREAQGLSWSRQSVKKIKGCDRMVTPLCPIKKEPNCLEILDVISDTKLVLMAAS